MVWLPSTNHPTGLDLSHDVTVHGRYQKAFFATDVRRAHEVKGKWGDHGKIRYSN